MMRRRSLGQDDAKHASRPVWRQAQFDLDLSFAEIPGGFHFQYCISTMPRSVELRRQIG
jgi:hypothetical protein